MASATADNLETTAAGDDYGQALAEGEITRLLKTVQAAQFKKSETIARAEDTSFKPRSLVEIAFAAEQKRQQAEQAAREAEQAAAQASAAEAQGPSGLTPEDQAGDPVNPGLSETASDPLSDTAAGGTDTPQPEGMAAAADAAQATEQNTEQTTEQAAEQAARQQREQEDEALRLAAEEQGYKRGFEAGLDAARTAEPTEEELALQAEKEAEKQAVVKQFHEAIAALAGPDVLDSTALIRAVDEAVCQLAAERAGLAIAENPEGFLQRIRQLVDKVNAASQRADVFVNRSDLAVMDKWMSCKHPWASSVTSTPRSSRYRAFQASGRSRTANSPFNICRSNPKRMMMCRLYVASSASTRMNPGATTLAAPYKALASKVRAPSPKMSWAKGVAHSQKVALRPTWFSHIRLCDSWIPSDMESPTGSPIASERNPCS